MTNDHFQGKMSLGYITTSLGLYRRNRGNRTFCTPYV